MQIVQKSQHVRVESYSLSYEWRAMPGAGFGFPCDRQGNLLLDEMPEAARQNLADCQQGKIDVVCLGVRDESWTRFEPSVGRCECGRRVELAHFTNTCDCGREYNSCGQLLASRSQWEEPWSDDGLAAWGDETGGLNDLL